MKFLPQDALEWWSVGIGGALIFLLLLLGWSMWEAYRAPTFSLRKDQWVCVATHQEERLMTVPTGKTTLLIPRWETVCDEWRRK